MIDYALGLALCGALYFLPDIYHAQKNALGLALAPVVGAVASLRYRFPMALFVSYLTAQSFFLWWDFGNFPINKLVSAALLNFQATLICLVVFMAIAIFRPCLTTIARVLAPIWAVLTLVGYPPLWNYSCNAAMLVAFIPFQKSWLLVALCVAPALMQMGTTPLFLLGVLFSYEALRRGYWRVLAVGLAGTAVWGYFHPWRFDEHERFDFYAKTMRFFWQNVSHWFGTGLGTFQAFGPSVQGYKNDGAPLWLSVHSDFIETFFNLGFLGTGLLLFLIVDSYRRSDHPHRMALIAMVAFAVFYFPLAIPFCAVWCAALVAVPQFKT